jgi:hypothetical protein
VEHEGPCLVYKNLSLDPKLKKDCIRKWEASERKVTRNKERLKEKWRQCNGKKGKANLAADRGGP